MTRVAARLDTDGLDGDGAGGPAMAALFGSVGPEAEPSLRERKKAKTREALIEASQRLIAERGYTGTTLDDIAAEVDITVQTLLRYFESKAQLALAPMTAPLEMLGRFLEADERSVDTLTVWRLYVRLEAAEAAAPSEAAVVDYVANLRAYHAWVDKDPALVASYASVERWLEETLAGALARDAGVGADDLHSTLVAALLVAGRRAVWTRWLDGADDVEALVADHLAVVDYAAASLPRGELAAG